MIFLEESLMRVFIDAYWQKSIRYLYAYTYDSKYFNISWIDHSTSTYPISIHCSYQIDRNTLKKQNLCLHEHPANLFLFL